MNNQLCGVLRVSYTLLVEVTLFLQILMNAVTELSVLILTRNVLIYLEHLTVNVKMATSNCGMGAAKVLYHYLFSGYHFM